MNESFLSPQLHATVNMPANILPFCSCYSVYPYEVLVLGVYLSPIKFVHRDIFEVFADDRLGHFPYLDEIVFRCTANHPWFGLVPAEVGNMISMATVHEQTASVSTGARILRNSLTVLVGHPPGHLVVVPPPPD